jgi:hypothetical protein
MFIDVVVWDDPDDPRGNVQHIAEHEVTIEDVEDVLLGQEGTVDQSHETGDPIIFGRTSTGKHIAVIFTFEVDPELIIVRPKTAYEVPERYSD